jgi:hypothetical protein
MMERRGARARFYNPKTVPRKEGKDLDSDSIGGNEGRKSDSRRGKEEGALTGGAMVSATAREDVARSRQQRTRVGLPGLAQGGEAGKRPRGDGPRAENQAAARGGGLAGELWTAGLHRPKTGENEIPFSFSFSIISKHFQMVLNPILNLNQTTQHKNSNVTA